MPLSLKYLNLDKFLCKNLLLKIDYFGGIKNYKKFNIKKNYNKLNRFTKEYI